MIRVLIVDDEALVRDGLSAILESDDGIEVVGEATNGVDAIASTRGLRPDVVLMDIRMPEMDGIQATEKMTAQDDIDAKVLILTTFGTDEYVYDALRAGASGFLLKDVPKDDLMSAIRTIAQGDALLSPALTKKLIDDFVAKPRQVEDPTLIAPLSDREREVFELVARGLSNAEIGSRLFLSEPTVKTHVGAILRKLGLKDRIHAVILAYESGYMRPGQQSES